MSKKRLIPKLQLATSKHNSKKLVVVITKQFGDKIEIGDPVSQSKIFQDQSADELIFLNIESNRNNVKILSEVIAKVSEEIFMPLTVGGGISSDEDFRLLLSNGADKISINTHAVENPSFITEMSQKYGASCLVVSIDYRKEDDGFFQVYIQGGTYATGLDPIQWAIKAEKLGAGELLLTCIDHDGMRNGLELEIPSQIVKQVNIPVICGGGCGLAQHFSNAFLQANVEAVCAGSFFAHRDQNLIQTRAQISNAGVLIRMQN
jgi:cyclase